jgi:cytochrome d ubiquinol oxidase subunit I
MKIAAMEAMWHTEPAPASLILFGIPNQKTQTVDYAIRIPYLLGLIATRSISEPLLGIDELIAVGKEQIREGIKAYDALTRLLKNPKDVEAKTQLETYEKFLGYALLLKKYTNQVTEANDELISKAAQDLQPKVLPLFISFRLMVMCGFFFILLFATGFYLSIRHKLHTSRWYHHIAMWSLPLPWVAAELGWVVAEYGRQPWVVQGILPTAMGASSINVSQALTSLSGFVIFYTVLAIIEVYLMIKYIRKGPDDSSDYSLIQEAT